MGNLQLDIAVDEAVQEDQPVKKKRPFIEPGWYRDLSNEKYHGSFGFSSTTLKKFIQQTPAHVDYQRRHPIESTKNMNLGTTVHTLVLEPENFKNEIAVMPDYNLRTKVGREERDDFLERHKGFTIITAEQLDTAKAMAKAVENHEEAMLLLNDSIRESSIYWWYNCMDPDDDTEYREMLKVRPDALGRAHPGVIDLKSCDDATFSGFQRSMQRFYYHVSAAMYLEGVNQCEEALEIMGVFACKRFFFICVENTAPYVVAVYECSPEYLDIGKALYRRSVYQLKRAKEQEWPAIPGIRVIEPPAYAKNLWIV